MPKWNGYSGKVNCSSGVYGLGLIGSLIYFVGNAQGFWMGVLGVLKALVWPAFLVHGLLGMVGA